MNKIKKLALITLIAFGTLSLSGCSDSQVKDLGNFLDNVFEGKENKNYEIDASVDELIAQVEIEEGKEKEYDRDSYTSNSQSYSYNGEKYTSIRTYSYYASVWYNDETDTYLDPYNGETINNLRSLDFDHIIPLHYVNLHGGDEWTGEQKREYADNPKIGVNANAHDNRAKGDKGPAEWLPSKNVDDYCYTWLVVAVEYDLSMDQNDMNVIKKNLDGVPAEELQIINRYKE